MHTTHYTDWDKKKIILQTKCKCVVDIFIGSIKIQRNEKWHSTMMDANADWIRQTRTNDTARHRRTQ